ESHIRAWAGRYGDARVVEWVTGRVRQMAYALLSFNNAITAAELSHSGDQLLNEHMGNAVRRPIDNLLDDQERPLWLIEKERPDSPLKMDGAMAACLSWEARTHALAKGIAHKSTSIYETRGFARI
ncbi:MAG: terminase, partial [Lysobacter sp.]|nr:terminase [Lysobacter sp.]